MWHAVPNLKSMLNYIPGSWLWTYQRISVFQVYISWAKACSHLVKGITWTSFFCRIPIPKDFSFSEELVFPDFYPIWAKGTLSTKKCRWQKSLLMLYSSGSRLWVYTGRRSYPWQLFYPAHIPLLAKRTQTDVKAGKPFQPLLCSFCSPDIDGHLGVSLTLL
jgi:hypothetical protein